MIFVLGLVHRVSFDDFGIDNQVFKLKFPKHRYVRADFRIPVVLREKVLPFFIRDDEWQIVFN